MTANAKPTKHKKTLDEYEREKFEDIPEWTAEDFARARPLSDFPELAEALERARGERGPQKAPTKERVALRLDREIVAHFRATGPGWQTRINNALAELVKRGSR